MASSRVAITSGTWFPRGDLAGGAANVKSVEPEVYLVARPELDYDEVARLA